MRTYEITSPPKCSQSSTTPGMPLVCPNPTCSARTPSRRDQPIANAVGLQQQRSILGRGIFPPLVRRVPQSRRSWPIQGTTGRQEQRSLRLHAKSTAVAAGRGLFSDAAHAANHLNVERTPRTVAKALTHGWQRLRTRTDALRTLCDALAACGSSHTWGDGNP